MIHIPEGVRIEQLRFHYAEEVFHHGVVQAVALAAHALDDVQPFPCPALGIGRFQHFQDHLQVGMVRYGIADDFPVVHVEYR